MLPRLHVHASSSFLRASCRGAAPGILGALVAFALAACSSSSSSSNASSSSSGSPAAAGTVGALCSTSSPCGAGLTCAQSGTLTGRCTADCGTIDNCASLFGAKALCLDGSQCDVSCVAASDCPGKGDECSPLTSGRSACVPNRSTPPNGTPPPNGACTNLGGLFGDTVVNGGYRCSGQNDIQQCQSGTWVPAMTCTCKVTSSITGTQNPSRCFDIDAPNTARCEYTVDYCEQCAPGGGCQAH